MISISSFVSKHKDSSSIKLQRSFTISKKLPSFLKETPNLSSKKRTSFKERRQRQALLGTSYQRRKKDQGRQEFFRLSTKGTTGYDRMPFRKKTGFRRRRTHRWNLRRREDRRIGWISRRFFHSTMIPSSKQDSNPLSIREQRSVRIHQGNQRMDWQTRRGMNHGNRFLQQKAIQTRRKQTFRFSRPQNSSGILVDYFLRYVLGVEMANVRQGRKSVSVALPSFPRRRTKRRIRRRTTTFSSSRGNPKENLFLMYQERIRGKGSMRKQRKRTLETLELRKRVRQKRWWPKQKGRELS